MGVLDMVVEARGIIITIIITSIVTAAGVVATVAKGTKEF